MRTTCLAAGMSRVQLSVTAAIVGLSFAVGMAGQQAETRPARVCEICQSKERFNRLVPGIKWGADVRVRAIYDNNLRINKDAAGHERFWSRYRGRVWTTITPFEDLKLNIRIVTEPRVFCKPDIMEEQTIRQEALFDQMNLKWSNALGLPLTLTVGRQDIKLGNGWLVIEGTPRDGTRTFFFDAVRGTWHAKDVKTTLDVIALRNHANSSWFIRPFNDRGLDLIEHDETGVIVYASNKSLPNTTVDGYFIYKHDDRVLPNGNNSDIYTFGGRAAGDIDEHWQYQAEIAPQLGHKNGVNICALGANGDLAYNFRDRRNNRCHVGYEFRSGADDRDGAFDILWGRFPHWSNIFNDYVAGLEFLGSQPSNFHRVTFGWSCELLEKLTLLVDYHLLFAHRNTFAGTAGFSGHGKFRGQCAKGLLKYTITEHLSGHTIVEAFFPGDYYDDTRNDPAVFVRQQLVLSW